VGIVNTIIVVNLKTFLEIINVFNQFKHYKRVILPKDLYSIDEQ